MRGSELIGLPVRGLDGRPLGRVVDVRLVQDGPLRGAFAALRVDGLVVGRHRVAAHLGYDRARVRSPWLIHFLVTRLTRENGLLPWSEARIGDGAVLCDREQLDEVPEI